MSTTLVSAEKTAFLPVSPDDAFALLTEPERLRRWQTVSARVDLRAGGEYRWTVVPGHVAAGTFTEVEPGKRIVFGWGWEGADGFGAGCVHRHRRPSSPRTAAPWSRSSTTGSTEDQAHQSHGGLEPLLRATREGRDDGDAGRRRSGPRARPT